MVVVHNNMETIMLIQQSMETIMLMWRCQGSLSTFNNAVILNSHFTRLKNELIPKFHQYFPHDKHFRIIKL